MSSNPAASRSTPHQIARWHSDKKTLLMLLLGLTVGLEFFENGMFVFASSHIIGGIDAAPREFAQVLATYAIGSMLMIGLQQWFSRHFGYRRYLSASLLLFLAGTLASASATDLTSLSLARGVQGFGGGALFTSCRVLVPVLFSPTDRPRALKYFMLTLFGLSACAPVLAGALIDHWGWRWIFLAAVPVGLLALAGLWTLLPDAVGRSATPVHWTASPLMLFAAAISLMQMGLSEARYDVLGHPVHLMITALLGIACLVWFLWHQWHHHEPLFRLRELTHPSFLLGLGLYFLFYCLSNTSNYLFPILAEQALGFPVVRVGWLNTFSAAISLAVAYAYLKYGGRRPNKKPFMVLGAVAMVLSAWGFASMPADAPIMALLPALAAKGVFGVLLVLPVANLTFRELGDASFAHAYQSKNLMRQLAASFATAMAAIVLQHHQFSNQTQLAGMLSPASAPAQNWLDSVQAGFAAQGLAPGAAHTAALAELSRTVQQQAQLLACEDLYRMLAVCALATAALVLAQRRFK